jgi:signal transduction histidine kinase
VQFTQVGRSALANCLRHSKANHVSLRLSLNGRWAQLEIHDDGVGFDATVSSGGMGLPMMRRRMAEAGGSLRVESTPGKGSKITAQAPWEKTSEYV